MADPNQILSAANEFYSVILEKLRNEQGVHAETAIAAAARMAGTFLLRSFNLPIENLTPGDAVLSDAANEKGPVLINVLEGVLKQIGVSLDPGKISLDQQSGDKPHFSVIETQALVENSLAEVKSKHQLDYEEAARAAAITTAFFVKECSSVLDPHAGFSIALYGFVEGSKTVPQK
jgi:hypothetical protein